MHELDLSMVFIVFPVLEMHALETQGDRTSCDLMD